MKYSVKYFPEKRNDIIENVPVTMSVTFAKQRMLYFTGLRCNINADPRKSQWDAEKGCLKKNQITPNGKTSSDFNAELTRLTNAINYLFKLYDVTAVVPTKEMVRQDLKLKLGRKITKPLSDDFWVQLDAYMKSSEFSQSRQMHYFYLANKLRRFDPKLTFDSLDIPKFSVFLGAEVRRNSACLYLTALKTFFKSMRKNLVTKADPFLQFEIPREVYRKPIYLTIAERDFLKDAEIANAEHSIVRDVFIIQCFLGCRYGDLMRFKTTNISSNALNYIALKTRKEDIIVAHVPLGPKVMALLAKFNEPNDRLVPYTEVTSFNNKLKRVFKNAGLTRLVTIQDKKTLLDKQVPIWELASSHMARRIFIGGLHKKNVKNETIASMSGHVKNSEAFGRYYDTDEEEQRDAVSLIE